MKCRKNILVLLLTFLGMACLLTGCIPGDGTNGTGNPAGFFSGIWHGWVAPVSLIISIFNKNISIYEIYNNGFWYNLGFYMAIISGFGGVAFSRRKKNCTTSSQ